MRQSDKDVALIVGAGITLHEGLKAADMLQAKGVHVRVMDIFCLKPIDQEALIANAKACGGKVVTVEDHYPAGMKSYPCNFAQILVTFNVAIMGMSFCL